MPLNPLREALSRAGLTAFHNATPFKSETDAALARFQMLRDDLEHQVRRGDLTIKVARERARAAAAELKSGLYQKAEGYSPVPRAFLDRLVEAGLARKRIRDTMGLEGLQRETNRLLRLTLIEQQLQSREAEFRGRTFVRSLPGGKVGPTIDSLVAFHDAALLAGDDAASEWARRQLEAMRTRTTETSDLQRIDETCDRPETVNPRMVARYVEALGSADVDTIEGFVNRALDDRDASACVAAFVLARETNDGGSLRWVRQVLNGLGKFPDAALGALRTLEVEARSEDSQAARLQAEYATALAESQAKLAGIDAPSESDLARQSRIQSKPIARLGEPIGLALDRRGADIAIGSAQAEIETEGP
ncbi:MAG: hypothetical protein U0794_17430 [Isosphaeraceae bacterium]